MMYHLPRFIGMARTKNLLFGGATISAQEALDLGLAAQVVPDDQVEAAGPAEAARLAKGAAEVMGLAKTLMARSFRPRRPTCLRLKGSARCGPCPIPNSTRARLQRLGVADRTAPEAGSLNNTSASDAAGACGR